MDITEQMHIAGEISSEAEVETMESYEDRINYYISQNYTYIPIPEENKYYNTQEGWLKNIDKEQYISVECHLVDVLELLQELPFLLTSREHNSFVFVNTEDNKYHSIYKLGALDEVCSKEDVKDRIRESDTDRSNSFEEYLDVDGIELKTIDEAIDDNIDLGEYDFIPYSDRYSIITVSDINKRQMKDMLYRLFAELVSNLGEKIEDEYPDSNTVLKYTRQDTIGRWKKEQIEGLNIHISEHLNLIDMMNVIEASDRNFVQKCGFDSKDDVDVLSAINDVRNSVMHANRSLVYSRRDIEDILKAVEYSQDILQNMD